MHDEMHEKSASRRTRRRAGNLPIQRTAREVICDSCQESSVQRFGMCVSSGLTPLFCGSPPSLLLAVCCWLSADADATPSALSTEREAPELDMNQFQMPG